ncbi:MAG: hypothetical protein ACJ795_10970, partial [Ktedonobacteraceae bacterium]
GIRRSLSGSLQDVFFLVCQIGTFFSPYFTGIDPCGRPRPSRLKDEGDHKGPHSTTQPLPPLRG